MEIDGLLGELTNIEIQGQGYTDNTVLIPGGKYEDMLYNRIQIERRTIRTWRRKAVLRINSAKTTIVEA